MAGIPELASLRHLPLPKPAMKLDALADVYRQKSPSTDKSKREALATFRRLAEHAEAATLDDLALERLTAFRDSIESCPTLKSAGTRAAYYGRIKTVIGFGLKAGIDQSQIKAALDRWPCA